MAACHEPPLRPWGKSSPPATLCPPFFGDLMQRCCANDPALRPSFDAIAEELRSLDVPTLMDAMLARTADFSRSTDLLHNVFPPRVAKALKEGKTVDPEHYDWRVFDGIENGIHKRGNGFFFFLLPLVLTNLLYELFPHESRIRIPKFPPRLSSVTVFFSDIVGYTDISSQLPAEKVMNMLNRCGPTQAEPFFGVSIRSTSPPYFPAPSCSCSSQRIVSRLYTQFDALTLKYGLFKVETIGGATGPPAPYYFKCACSLRAPLLK